MGRLKTGTPPRLHRRSIDFDGSVARGEFQEERGDEVPVPFSFETDVAFQPGELLVAVHERAGARHRPRAHRDSPLYNGRIRGVGPRYCPVTRRQGDALSGPGASSAPSRAGGPRFRLDLRQRSVDVAARRRRKRRSSGRYQDSTAEMIRPGYAVEYDFVQPTELRTRSSKAGGWSFPRRSDQRDVWLRGGSRPGLVAGINAGLAALDRPHFEPRRDESYIGMLIDDLVTHGCLEPYRMFTSRAEHRLLLRIDNADLRLTPYGRAMGLIDDLRWKRFEERRSRYASNLARLESTVEVAPGERLPAMQALRRPEVRLSRLIESGLDLEIENDLDVASLETAVKYEGYLKQEASRAERLQRSERRRIPPGFPFGRVPGLSNEVVQRLNQISPETLAQASRVPGVTPAAVAVLNAYLSGYPDVKGRDDREGVQSSADATRQEGRPFTHRSCRGQALDVFPASRQVESEDQPYRLGP